MMKLLDYQKAWLNDNSNSKIALVARRVGFTTAIAHNAVKRNKDQAYFAASLDGAKAFIDYVYDHALEQNIKASKPSYHEEPHEQGPLGYYTCVVRQCEIRAYARLAIIKARVCDVTIDDAAYQPELLRAVQMYSPTALTWGGQLSVISGHNGISSEFNTLLNNLGKPWSLHKVTLKDATTQGLFKRICEVNGQQWSQQAEDAWLETLYQSNPHARQDYDCIPEDDAESVAFATLQAMVKG